MSVVDKLGSALGVGQDINSLKKLVEENRLELIPARVTDIVLDNQHPDFNDVGQWNGIGIIEFEEINNQGKINKGKAKPLISQVKQYPLVNELVVLVKLPNANIGSNVWEKSYYYISTISLWNHPHHNAYPNIFENENDDEQETDYALIEGGAVGRTKDETTAIDLNSKDPSGGIFTERTNIHPLNPYVGDSIIEGRWGNSIRFGSTIKSFNGVLQNNWSGVGQSGDPITIIRNGQPISSSDEGWFPTVENINNDLSSIYMTSTQMIPLSASSTNYTGLKPENVPSFPAEYTGSQVIINSGRVVLNSSIDSILFSSKKVISLSAQKDIGLSTSGSMGIEAKQGLALGSADASQPVLKGETFLTQLKPILNQLQDLCGALENEPNLALAPTIAGVLKTQIGDFIDKYDDYTSKIVKTI